MTDKLIPGGENILKPDIEGLRIIGKVDVNLLGSLRQTDDEGIWLSSGDPVPVSIEPLQSIMLPVLERYPSKEGCIHVSHFSYSEERPDPFHAGLFTDFTDPISGQPVHRDEEVEVAVLVSDRFPTIFYPTDGNGHVDMERGWQPKPGDVVEINNEVWHSAPIKVEGSGVRTLVTLRIMNDY